MSAPQLHALWLYPPLAFARLGNADTPLDAFTWGPNDDTPAGTGKTTIQPAESLYVREDGTVFSSTPERICFQDESGHRPVCPFFELHAEWEDASGVHQGPLTPGLVDPTRLRWSVHVANSKPYNITLDEQTRIEARLTLEGTDVTRKDLQGRAPASASDPLVPAAHFIPLGFVQLTKPKGAFPEFRLRFTPARGTFYGPPTLPEPWRSALPPEQLFLNERSSWCAWKPGVDPRTTPGGQFAHDDAGVCLGLVDDTCDGIISCEIDGLDVAPAVARIVVTPPDLAPDRRPPVSIADGFKDRVSREEVSAPTYVADVALVTEEITDLLERAFETAGLMNLDALNDLFDTNTNPWIARTHGVVYQEADRFRVPPATPSNPLPLTTMGRDRHRRFLSREVLADFVRKRPELIAEWIRDPSGADPFFNTKMPIFMRGSTGDPLHVTRRQYDLLVAWAGALRAEDEPGS